MIMPDSFKEACTGYYKDKLSHTALFDASAQSTTSSDVTGVLPGKPISPAFSASSGYASTIKRDPAASISGCRSPVGMHELQRDKDGHQVSWMELANKANDNRRQDERSTDKASQERRKKWAEIDKMLGLPPTKW